VKHLNLKPQEQTSLTKLSLSKIVSNLERKLKEEEKKNQLTQNKLEQAASEKEAYKIKYENLKKKIKQEQLPTSVKTRMKEPIPQFNSGGAQDSQPSGRQSARGIERPGAGLRSLNDSRN